MSKEGSVLDPDLVDEALGGVGEVYHVAGLPGMWIPELNNFHAVNCSGAEVVIATARKRGIARFLHRSTESIQRAWFLSWNVDRSDIATFSAAKVSR
jgi:dihydroflavonol-4-reductase